MSNRGPPLCGTLTAVCQLLEKEKKKRNMFKLKIKYQYFLFEKLHMGFSFAFVSKQCLNLEFEISRVISNQMYFFI